MHVYYKVNVIYDKNNKDIDNHIANLTNVLNLRAIDYELNNPENESINMYVIFDNGNLIFKNDNQNFMNIDDFFKNNFVVPRIFINQIDYPSFIEKISKMIYQKERDKAYEIEKYNKIFRNRFNVPNGLNDIYEENTGAIYFKDYEMELIKDNKLKDLFLTKNNDGSLVYSLPTDKGVMMRGVETYYFFIAKTSRFKNYIYNDVDIWYKNYSDFFLEALEIVKNYNINNQYDLRLILALIDNIRNYILLLMNSELVINGNYQSNIYYIDESKDNIIDNYAKLIKQYQNIINNICLDNELNNDLLFNVKDLLVKTLVMSKETFHKIKKQSEDCLKKCLCKNREMDHYFENLIGCDYAINSINNNQEINLITLLYGGLELPFIIKNANFISNKINIGLSYQNKGDYLKRQELDKNEFTDLNIKEYGNVDRKKDTIIIDDNIMSGVTMQLLYNELYYHGYNIKCLIGLRHPDLNRIAQIKHFNQIVNIGLINKFIYGFLFETPYTKIIENTNYNNLFTNRLNFYSIPSKVFLESMYLNGNYEIDSEVDIFKGGENEKFKNRKTYFKKA